MLLLFASTLRAQDAPRYAVQFDATTLTVGVELCLAQSHPHVAFAADSAWAMSFVHDLRRSTMRATDAGDGAWTANDWQAGECLRYRVDLGALADTRKPDVGWRLGDDIAVAPQLWLLRPDAQGDVDAQLRIALPAGWAISAPWHELSRSANAAGDKNILFNIPNTPADWSATVAIGHFDEEQIVLPGGVLRLSILHGADAQQRQKLRAWLVRAARAVLGAYGRMPLPDVQVLIIPVGARGRAVMFGQSVRGEGNALQLLVDPSRPAAEFAADWKAVHELSH